MQSEPLYLRNIIYFSCLHLLPFGALVTGADAVALIMLGGGWHNNHHRHPRSARHGLRWWELDVTYQVLVVLGWLGIVSAIRVAPRSSVVTAAAASRTWGRSHRRC
jgi:hypothetical protein